MRVTNSQEVAHVRDLAETIRKMSFKNPKP